jgi:futalosine hydrolase
MILQILLVSATDAEADALRKIHGIIRLPHGIYKLDNYEISILVTGVGSVSTAWAMKQWLTTNSRPDIAINVGIAGSYRDEIKIGDIVIPISDCFADMGIETSSGYLTLAEAGLSDPDKYPFKGGQIIASNRYTDRIRKYLRPVRAVTVNTATGSLASIRRLSDKYNPDIETMEGATFFYICAMEEIPFIAIRGISNRVEPRNKRDWNITQAINNLSLKLKEILLTFE